MANTTRILLALLLAAATAMSRSPFIAFHGWKYESHLSSRAAPQRLLASSIPSPNPDALNIIKRYLAVCATDLKFAALVSGICYCAAANLPDPAPYPTEPDTLCHYPVDGWSQLSYGGMMDSQAHAPKVISLYPRKENSLERRTVNRMTAAIDDGGLVSATSQAPIPTGQLVVQEQGLEGLVRFEMGGNTVHREPAKSVVGAVVGSIAVMLAFLIVS